MFGTFDLILRSNLMILTKMLKSLVIIKSKVVLLEIYMDDNLLSRNDIGNLIEVM